MNTCHTNGVTLAYDSFGAVDQPAVLLISGLGVPRTRWRTEFCQQLAGQGYRVIRYDNRDAGGSTALSDRGAPDFAALAATLAAGRTPVVPYTLHDMAADALGLLDALGIARAHIIGRSMGGMIAQLLAADAPTRVGTLTAIMSSTGNPALPGAAPDVMALLARPAPSPATDMAGYLAHGLAFAQRIAGSGYPVDAAAQTAMLRAEAATPSPAGGFARQLAAIAATGDLRPRLATVHTPTLVIHGDDDALIPPACGADIAANIAGAQLLRVPGMGHDMPAALDATLLPAIVTHLHQGA